MNAIAHIFVDIFAIIIVFVFVVGPPTNTQRLAN
jgi:hypothetical protein